MTLLSRMCGTCCFFQCSLGDECRPLLPTTGQRQPREGSLLLTNAILNERLCLQCSLPMSLPMQALGHGALLT
ncbi:hypothetical protein DUNSADRAFT_6066 [Dunaliella salina]|uniref:Encoded protein n=1 Tax=Dunaliella salina TaxID=3046 RepID=A0ABQ7GP12_DUNSA|nr:hypothetical protein DUNSADRAFT_6066 [Dunaliella salina]|eukprot:KAF5836339.1 hypothetical protein DUNSADRAFT_6066 [Dunaliella salina]